MDEWDFRNRKQSDYYGLSMSCVLYRNKLSNTYDFINGSPRLQRNKAPTPGGSVATKLSAAHVVTSLDLYWLTKSRGSTGKSCRQEKIWSSDLSQTNNNFTYLAANLECHVMRSGARERRYRIYIRGIVCRRNYPENVGNNIGRPAH